MNGRLLTWGVISEAVRLLKTELVPKPGTTKPYYRVSAAVSILFQFLAPFLRNGEELITKPLNSGKQTITVSDEFTPVGQPSAKMLSELQASGTIILLRQPLFSIIFVLFLHCEPGFVVICDSRLTGEAVYVDDVPAPADCLHAALVLSEKAKAKILKLDAEPGLQAPGAVAFISAADIPPTGQNLGVNLGALSKQALFATDIVESVGHLMGVMVSSALAIANNGYVSPCFRPLIILCSSMAGRRHI